MLAFATGCRLNFELGHCSLIFRLEFYTVFHNLNRNAFTRTTVHFGGITTALRNKVEEASIPIFKSFLYEFVR
jgi:hypothetical protein